jgi:hypothetical protein
MTKTADFIAEQQSVKGPIGSTKTRRGTHPNSLKNLVAPWQPGKSGNPGGKPKHDIAKEIAQAVFSENREAIYKAMSKALLKGNAYVFKEIAERGFGKLTETKQITHAYQDVTDSDIDQRIAALLADLGLEAQINALGRAEGAEGRTGPTNGAAKDTEILSR